MISTNWRAQPLTSHEVIVDLIGSTTIRSDLNVRAELDQGSHAPKEMTATKAQFARGRSAASSPTPSMANGTTQ